MGSLTATAVEERIIERDHHALRMGLSNLEGTIEEAYRLSRGELADRTARATAWAHREFAPHAAWEEAWLYGRLDQATGSPWATRALRYQHEQIRELATALEIASVAAREHWTGDIVHQVVAAMTRLHAVLAAHLAQEELFVVPLLGSEVIDAARAADATPV
ncbi:MAG TPA: hemerythrin domain-containing protein [Candidatus Dormibacteraeota bacterium]|nr:hemerythrin domain-containing protein [Candidatus Dormibacteraeota bacterium]